MGDLLIRDLDETLKRQLQESARRNGRSLSDEALDILRRQINREQSQVSAGKRLRGVIGEERFTDADLAAIAALRKEHDREPPHFD